MSKDRADKTRGKNNYPLQNNVDPAEIKQGYLLTKIERVRIEQVGKLYDTHKLTNPIDKSFSRHSLKKAKKK